MLRSVTLASAVFAELDADDFRRLWCRRFEWRELRLPSSLYLSQQFGGLAGADLAVTENAQHMEVVSTTSKREVIIGALVVLVHAAAFICFTILS
jgi:hypothetical protein